MTSPPIRTSAEVGHSALKHLRVELIERIWMAIVVRRVYIVVIASLNARHDFNVTIEVTDGKRLGRDGDVHLELTT